MLFIIFVSVARCHEYPRWRAFFCYHTYQLHNIDCYFLQTAAAGCRGRRHRTMLLRVTVQMDLNICVKKIVRLSVVRAENVGWSLLAYEVEKFSSNT